MNVEAAILKETCKSIETALEGRISSVEQELVEIRAAEKREAVEVEGETAANYANGCKGFSQSEPCHARRWWKLVQLVGSIYEDPKLKEKKEEKKQY
jgi:hypothetical protein